jgi:pyroglutamyl-peptidase
LRILFSAFEPFGGRRRNTSADVLRKLKLRDIFQKDQVDCRKVLLPVNFDSAWPRLQKHIDRFKPDMLILTGEGKTAAVTLETAALNNRRAEPRNTAIDPQLPPIISSPLAEILARKLAIHRGISVEQNPGDYLCNFIYFQCLSGRPEIPAIFLHLSPLSDDEEPSCLPAIQALVEDALRLAAELVNDRSHKSN